MQFGALGDIHGDFDSVRRIAARHPEIPFWLCVGDVATADGRYEPFPAPVYFIKGNNENFDRLVGDSQDLPDREGPAHAVEKNLVFIPNARIVSVGGPFGDRLLQGRPLRVAGLGGTFAPTWYDTPAANLPHPQKGSAKATELADKRRHFVREEVEACMAMRGVDVLLTHEAPRPFKVGRLEAGKATVNEVLAAMQPGLHLFGHHHRFSQQERQGVRSVGLDLVSRSYLLIEAETLEYHVLTTDG